MGAADRVLLLPLLSVMGTNIVLHKYLHGFNVLWFVIVTLSAYLPLFFWVDLLALAQLHDCPSHDRNARKDMTEWVKNRYYISSKYNKARIVDMIGET